MFTDPANRQIPWPLRLRPALTGTVPPATLPSVTSTNERRRVPTIGGMLIAAQEEERSRIARELHDDINQQLALIAMEAQSIEMSSGGDPALAVRMHHLWEEVVRVSHDVENVSHELHSSALQHLGLASALLALGKQFQEKQHIVVKFEISGVIPKLSDKVALSLFRVAQECLRNISKHSGAHTATMRLATGGNNVWLRICDDGVGFRTGPPGADVGLGTTSMRERMRMIGGRLLISSKVFRGTCVAAVAPLAAFD